MRAFSPGLLSISIAISLAAAPAAAELQSASLTLTLASFPAATFEGNGSEFGTFLSPLSVTLSPGNAFAGAATFTIPLTAAPPISVVQFVAGANDLGIFRGLTPGAVGGPMLLSGRMNVRGFGGLTLLGVPLSLGIHHTIRTGAFGIFITAIGAPWRVGVASVTGITKTLPAGTIVKSTVRSTGSNNLTAAGSGTLNLVTPVKIITNLAGNLPSFGKLTLRFEPSRACEGKPLGAVCRAAGGPCDRAEICDGVSVDCPRNDFLIGVVCRPPQHECDLPESCDGSGPACPADQPVPDTDGDGLVDICDPFPDDPDNEQAQCDADLGSCVVDLVSCQDGSGLTECQSDLGVAEAQAGQCGADLSQAQGVLIQCQSDLAECVEEPAFDDADADGEHDATDRCPDTPAGAEVDDAGCSLDQFCRGIDPNTREGFVMCRVFADWKGDEGIGKDCNLVRVSRLPLRWGCVPR